jgi:hypothetical protein
MTDHGQHTPPQVSLWCPQCSDADIPDVEELAEHLSIMHDWPEDNALARAREVEADALRSQNSAAEVGPAPEDLEPIEAAAQRIGADELLRGIASRRIQMFQLRAHLVILESAVKIIDHLPVNYREIYEACRLAAEYDPERAS